jgi:hypothetical protein
MNAIKYLVVAFRIAIAATLCCAPLAKADDMHGYVRVLNSKDVHAASDDGDLPAAGHAVCEMLSEG